jgi:hypothetical protein
MVEGNGADVEPAQKRGKNYFDCLIFGSARFLGERINFGYRYLPLVTVGYRKLRSFKSPNTLNAWGFFYFGAVYCRLAPAGAGFDFGSERLNSFHFGAISCN